MLTANGNTAAPGSIVTPDGKSAGFLATYYGGDDPTAASATVLGTQVVPSMLYNGTGGAAGQSSFPAVGAQPRGGDPEPVPERQLVERPTAGPTRPR